MEGSNDGQLHDGTLNIGSAYPSEDLPSCLPVGGSPDIWHVQAPFECRIEPEHLDFDTRDYLWSNEQSLPKTATEECAGLQAFVSFPIGSESPSISDPSTLSTCTPTGIVDSRDDVIGEHNGGMGHSPMDRIATIPATLEDRFEMILETCKAAGYHSIDLMATEYYTASFPPNSHLAAIQNRSRSQGLPELLDSLYTVSSAWNHERQSPWAFNESEKFRETILRLATNILIGEASQIERPQIQPAGVAQAAAEEANGQASPDGLSTDLRQRVKENVSSTRIRPLYICWLTKNIIKVPGTWSSLSELVGSSGVSQSLVPHDYMSACRGPEF